MTDLEALECIVVDLTPKAKEHNKEEIEQSKKSLEVLEIIKKYLVRTFDYPEGGNYFCLELHKFIYEKEGMKFKEWLENAK